MMEAILYIIAIIVMLVVVYISTRLIAKAGQKITNAKNIKIIEKVPVSINNFLMIVEIDGFFYVLGVTKDKIEIIDKRKDLEIIEDSSANFSSVLSERIKNTINKNE